MASVGIQCGGSCRGGGSLCSFDRHSGGRVDAGRSPCSLVISSRARPQAASGALLISRNPRRGGSKFPGFGIEGAEDRNNESWVVADRRLDQWMTTSVSELVKYLPEAPLVVQVYDKNRESSGRGFIDLSTETEVGPDYWDAVRAKWENGEASVPEGVMFVEELVDDEEKPDGVRCDDDTGDRIDRIWGIVVLVQGKGADCSVPACYFLQTSRVSSGLGLSALHFFLMRVNNFREKAASQLKNSWLVQRPENEE